jgi:hypothetical protein
MSWKTRAALAAVMVVGGAVAASAAPDGNERRIRSRISVDVQDEPIDDVMRDIGLACGRNILVDPAVEGRITITLRDVSWRIAVGLIAERAGCKVRQHGAVLVLYQPVDLVDVELYDANVRTVLLLLARYAGKSIVIGPKVQGKITLSLRRVSAVRALQAVARTAGDFLVLAEPSGTSSLKTIPHAGSGSSKAPAKAPAPADRSFHGRLKSFAKGVLELTLKNGKIQRFALPKTKKARATHTKLLQVHKPGALLNVGAVRRDDGWQITHIVAPTRPRAKSTKK